MFKIKLTMPGQPRNIDIFQFTGSLNNKYKNCEFFINTDEKEVDYWFIFEDLPEGGETSFIDSKNIFFLTAETAYPIDWYNEKYYDLFFSQFYEIYTCHPLLRDNIKSSIPFLPWMINSNHNTIFNPHKRNLNFFRNLVINKQKKISVICSNQNWQPSHKLRYNFVKKLKEYFGDTLDWYGNGINQVPEKWEAIAPYKYHIVLENRSDYNFITEKIFDSFLGGAFPIYWGAPNIDQFFPKKSFVSINILDFRGSVKIIEDILKSNYHENSQKELKEAKELVIGKYNLFNRIVEIVLNTKKKDELKKNVHLRPIKYFQKSKTFYSYFSLNPIKNINLLGKILRKLSNWIIKKTNK